jgi:hypothetical protein
MILTYLVAWIAIACLADRYLRRIPMPIALSDAAGCFWLVVGILVVIVGGICALDRLLPLGVVAATHVHLTSRTPTPLRWQDLVYHMAFLAQQTVEAIWRRLRL